MKKQKFIQIANGGSKAIQTTEDAKDFIDSIEEGEPFVFRALYMTQKEFEELPEFTGF